MTLELDGTVRLSDSSGRDLTPRGRKARALLALLGDAPMMRMTREALRSLLWSDRMDAQAGASLRRLLADLRSGSQGLRDGLVADAGWVGLNRALVDVRLPPAGAPERFAADLDLADAGFSDWISRRRRLRGLEGRSANGTLTLVLPEPGEGGHPVCDMILHDAVRRVAQYRPTLIRKGGGAGVRLSTFAMPDGAGLLTLHVAAFGEGAHYAQTTTTGPSDLPLVARHMSADLTRHLLAGVETLMGDLMSFDHDRLRAAVARLASGPDALRPEIATSLRAFGSLAIWLDRFEGDDALVEAKDLAAEGLRAAPRDPVSQAAAAIVFANSGDVEFGLALAQKALRLDEMNGFVRYAATTAFSHAGDATSAMVQAAAAAVGDLPGLSPETASIGAAMAAARAGDEARALDWARRAWLLAPGSRPAMRYVAALAYRAGDEETAARALRTLEVSEPGFSAAAMAEPDYPVANLREMGLLDVAWARHLGGARRGTEQQRRGGGK
ncbi:MAG: hypothetical protein AAF264_03365 [Pseudomonadota bacterium]